MSKIVVATTVGAATTAVRGTTVDGIQRFVEMMRWLSTAQAVRRGGVGEEIESGINNAIDLKPTFFWMWSLDHWILLNEFRLCLRCEKMYEKERKKKN
ncbi:hypothetical protein Ddye_008440 [Dipteronia dyeriana]|uniref:Uncharacterized protein n=1 Tax=Dipteronia dyeriana TaxID=168575 RepID=A0AAD9XAD0_9ROSI|nr:hypothetical protein Ddye_008440 [Dipteronia dyeriana]